MAVIIRQTNIIWMVFVACTGVIDVTLPHQRDDVKVDDFDEISKSRPISPSKRRPIGSNLRNRKFSSAVDTVNNSIPSIDQSSTAGSPGFDLRI